MRHAYFATRLMMLGLTAAAPAQFLPPPGAPIFVRPWFPARPTVIVVMPPMVIRPLPPLEPVEEMRRKDEIPINPDDVIVIRPRAGGMKSLPPPRQAIAPPPMPPEPQPKVPGFDVGGRQAPPPEADKLAESGRQQKLGREAFAAGEYGRAAERFEQATRVVPDQALGYFLLAQAQFALGKYRDAVATIHAGLKLQPDWPKAKFSARELYGENVAEHALHLERLRQAVERNPEEPALLFLYGYQLWFNRRHDEANTFFRRALPNVADPKPIERFLAEP